PDDTGGNGLKLEARALSGLHRANAGGGENTRKGGHETGNGKGDHLDTGGIDADGRGSRAIAAGSEDMVAQAVAMQQRPEGKAQKDEPDEGGIDAQQSAAEHGVEDRIGVEPDLHRAIDEQHGTAPEQEI